MKRILLIAVSIFAILLLIGVLIAFQFNLSAIPEPGRMETLFATQGKRFIIRRASLAVIAPAPQDKQASIKEGDKLFGTDCSECHGYSGRKPTDAGRWMYPRAADLGSADVRRYSDRELFWIVKTLLDRKERHPLERHARFRKSGIRPTDLEFSAFRQDASGEPQSERRGSHALKTRSNVLLFLSLSLAIR